MKGGTGWYETLDEALRLAGWDKLKPEDLPPSVQALRLKQRLKNDHY